MNKMEQETRVNRILVGVVGGLLLVLVGVASYVVGFDQGQRRVEVANGPMVAPKPSLNGQNGINLMPTPQPESQTVWVYFTHTDRAATDCESVFPVRREVIGRDSLELAAVEELLRGPTTEEQERGFGTAVPEGVGVRSVTVNGGTITADFDEGLQQGVAGSCLVQSIRAQIEETLRQFSDIDEVMISVNGETEEVLQP